MKVLQMGWLRDPILLPQLLLVELLVEACYTPSYSGLPLVALQWSYGDSLNF